MVLEPIYVDLSSSDDEDDNHGGGSTAVKHLSEVFHMDADDDDIIIIDKPTSTSNVRRDRGRVIRSALDDDECCILDVDPGADETCDMVSSLDTDELVMTGEKGPVAMRDFAHARYLCVHFPFKTTLHSKFCAQCHCYVCDSLAPCSSWGEGNNPNDHCHASEELRWKTLRKVARCGTIPSLATGAADLNGIGKPTGGNNLVQSNLLQHATTLPLATQLPASKPIGSGVSHKLHATVKKDPLVMKPKGKGRGKPPRLVHLGVRSARPHRSGSGASFPEHRTRPPLPRPKLPHLGRLEEDNSAASIAGQMPQPTSPNPRIGRPHHSSYDLHLPRSTSTASGGLEEVEAPVSTVAQSPEPTYPNLVSGRPRAGATAAAFSLQSRLVADVLARIIRPPGYQPPLAPLDPSPAPYNPTAFPPSLTSSSPPVTNVLWSLCADTIVSGDPPMADRRYVPASAMRVEDELSEGSLDLTTSQPQAAVQNISMIIDADYVGQTFSGLMNSAHDASSRKHVPTITLRDEDEFSGESTDLTFYPLPESIQELGMTVDTDYISQRFSSPVNSGLNASTNHTAHTASFCHTVDILPRPIEGWEGHAAGEFDEFEAGVNDGVPTPEQGPTFVNDVLQQMAGDEYLWEQFPGW